MTPEQSLEALEKEWQELSHQEQFYLSVTPPPTPADLLQRGFPEPTR